MKQTDQKYNCDVCGSQIEVLRGGEGNLMCCGENMKLVMEQAVDNDMVKKVPIFDMMKIRPVSDVAGTAPLIAEKPNVTALKDLLIYVLTGLSQVVLFGQKSDITDHRINRFTVKALFSTLTDVNYDPDRFFKLIHEAVLLRDTLKLKIRTNLIEGFLPDGPARFMPSSGLEKMIKIGESVGMQNYRSDTPDITLLKQTALYGIKWLSAYADHALRIDQEDDRVYAFIHEGLAAVQRTDLTLEDGVKLSLKCGKIVLMAVEMLNSGMIQAYGRPIPTKVQFGVKKGKAILVSGYDLKNLEHLLKQTQEKGITVYTHGEMLCAHAYPKLKKFSHFFGQFGVDRLKQISDFSTFPGAILMTTRCSQRPKKTIQNNIFTSGMVGWPGIHHISGFSFQPLIDKALSLPGFLEDKVQGEVMVGLAENAVLNVADILPGLSAPAFLSENILGTLVKSFDIKPVTWPDSVQIQPV
ncbi:hypothetical protein [Desulfobacula phenolica]|uniref:Hydroxylamine reductase n=1 Tax=Desulfobacula phenolica TaxID=90732 RepID=A0A1H2FEX5_9BACT|nr:hypothetical protein [Desulfobacula phenolica]SDU05926.1 hydroxylamine reductase [Desulfobacula phenolica]